MPSEAGVYLALWNSALPRTEPGAKRCREGYYLAPTFQPYDRSSPFHTRRNHGA